MRRATHALIPVLLLAIAVDFVLLDAGAFRFNTDESLVGVRSTTRVEALRVAAPDLPVPLPHAAAIAASARRPRRRAVAPGIRADAPAARSHLMVSADPVRSSEDH